MREHNVKAQAQKREQDERADEHAGLYAPVTQVFEYIRGLKSHALKKKHECDAYCGQPGKNTCCVARAREHGGEGDGREEAEEKRIEFTHEETFFMLKLGDGKLFCKSNTLKRDCFPRTQDVETPESTFS